MLSCNVAVVFAVIGFLLFGGITTIAQNDYLTYTTTNFPGKEGEVVHFVYPWFGNLLMFLAMSVVGIGWIFQHIRTKKDKRLYGGISGQGIDYSIETTTINNDDPSSSEVSDVLDSFRPTRQSERLSCGRRFMQNAWGVLIFSSIFDLLASGFGSIGLSTICNVPPSVYQMLQGAIIIFTALLSRCILKRKTTAQQNLGICICLVGLIMIAVASYLADIYFPDKPPPSPEDPYVKRYIQSYEITEMKYTRTLASRVLRFLLKPHERRRLKINSYNVALRYNNGTTSTINSNTFIRNMVNGVSPMLTEESSISEKVSKSTMLVVGIVLILISQLVYAGQFVVEEYTMSRINAFPTQVVCIEGIYGLLFSLAFVFPILMVTKVENDFEAFLFIKAQPNILLPMLIFCFTVALYNGFGQTITKLISANHRTILEGLRGLVVWIFAGVERAIFGEPWGEGIYGWTSIIEGGGFIILLIGSMIYYSIIKCRCFKDSQVTSIDNFAAIMEETSVAPYNMPYSETFNSETVSSSI